jgi:hypothetical protein
VRRGKPYGWMGMEIDGCSWIWIWIDIAGYGWIRRWDEKDDGSDGESGCSIKKIRRYINICSFIYKSPCDRYMYPP